MVRKNESHSKPGKKGLFEMIYRETILPLLLIVLVPNLMIPVMHAVINYQSNFSRVIQIGLWNFWRESWLEASIGDARVWSWILGMGTWATFSILCLGGEKYYGPPTKNGFKPEYIKSGFTYYLLTLAVFGAAVYLDLIPAWTLYKKMVQLAGALVVFGFVVCGLLLVKGMVSPSPGEFGSLGNPIFDFYWGLELYPRFGRWLDVKMWTNCRFGMMMWQLIILVAWKAQYEHSEWNYAMAATTILQTIFIAKFYWWEDGYMKSIDIIYDRAGFYICWGCIFFVPTFYTLTSTYMVENSPEMSRDEFWLIIAVGVAGVGLNYWPDYQKQLARTTDGHCHLWGSPAKIIRASYVDNQGKRRENVLLASGFWGLSRHINYVFEIGAAFLWETPAGFVSFVPFLYAIFLVGLLSHRSTRDEEKCKLKYGKHWQEYCKISKYQMVPYVF